MSAAESRRSEYPISSHFLERWSPRAFLPEEIPVETLLTLFDAAHWAPSSYNFQPWRFVYARRGGEHWDRLLGILNDFNRGWAASAAALVIVLSKTTAVPPGKDAAVDNVTHSFDAGAAWGYLALQASILGWQAHGMAGIDRGKARLELGVPQDYAVEAAVAIGRPGNKESLPDSLRAREVPSQRQALAELVFEGRFTPR
jgi:nitroreductase